MENSLNESASLGFLLFDAIASQDKAMISCILKNNPNMDVYKTHNDFAVRPLEYAILQDQQEIALLLIQAGAPLYDNDFYSDLEHRQTHGNPFLLASKRHQWPIAEAILSQLEILDEEYKAGVLNERLFLSVLAEDPEEFKNLVRLGADPNMSDPEIGTTPLFHACATGNPTMIDCVVDCGGIWDKQNKKGQTPKDYIVSNFPHLKQRYKLTEENVVKLSTRRHKMG